VKFSDDRKKPEAIEPSGVVAVREEPAPQV